MTTFPRPTWRDIDAFEEQLHKAVNDSSPEEIEKGLRRAMQYIEDQAEQSNLDMDHINNATSTAMTAFFQMVKRLRVAESELAQLKQATVEG